MKLLDDWRTSFEVPSDSLPFVESVASGAPEGEGRGRGGFLREETFSRGLKQY